MNSLSVEIQDVSIVWADQTKNKAKFLALWFINDRVDLEKRTGIPLAKSGLNSLNLPIILDMINFDPIYKQGCVSPRNAKLLMIHLWNNQTFDDPIVLAEELGLMKRPDSVGLASVVDQAITNNPKMVHDYQAGNDRVLGALVGVIVKSIKSTDNISAISKLLHDRLDPD